MKWKRPQKHPRLDRLANRDLLELAETSIMAAGQLTSSLLSRSTQDPEIALRSAQVELEQAWGCVTALMERHTGHS